MTYSPGGLPPQYHRRGRSLRPGSGCGRVYPRRCGHQETFSLWMDDTQSTVGSCQQKPVLRTTQSPRSLVRVGCAPCSASTSRLSSRWSSCDLTSLRSEGSHLEASFPLRCFQRLSVICVGYSAFATCMTADSPVTYSLRSSRTRSNPLQASCARSR